jgi:hypothetical protein
VGGVSTRKPVRYRSKIPVLGGITQRDKVCLGF